MSQPKGQSGDGHGAKRSPGNMLGNARSPYLLQHRDNPVAWKQWGPEAFAEARQRDVPIFLSIGYSTCYWCHVMERESFESERIAAVLNEHCVCIKVDREERPDIDDVYMAATQMLTGHGGWPMSVFLEPGELRPFWAGTYLPPVPARGMPSLVQVVERIGAAWKQRREDVVTQAQAVAKAIVEKLGSGHEGGPGLAGHQHGVVLIGPEQIEMAAQTLMTIFDRAEGGFGRAPKFPQPVYLEFLLDLLGSIDDRASQQAVESAVGVTLDKMAMGGVFDQVGGGFHRYSVDAFWTVPHFEKMLYDNAQLIGVYARAARRFDNASYQRVVAKTIAYVQREMTHRDGPFFSAQDAEVDGKEGLNYVWSKEQILTCLGGPGSADAIAACEVYGIDRGPNFQDPHHPNDPPTHVLRWSAGLESEASRLGVGAGDLLARMDRVNSVLLAERNKRKQPRLDDKVIASWNGLMIAGIARAAIELPGDISAGWRELALKAARWCERELVNSQGDVTRIWRESSEAVREGAGRFVGTLEDSAMLALGFLELARVTGDEHWVNSAERIIDRAREVFADHAGGFFDVAEGGELFIRPRSTYDGAMPTGISVMMHAMLSLGELRRSRLNEMLQAVARALASISSQIEQSPIAPANSTRCMLKLLSLPGGKSALERVMAGAKRSSSNDDQTVEVYADVQSVTISRDMPAQVHVLLAVAGGWHINDAWAGEQSGGKVVPLSVAIVGGTGVAVWPEMPKGVDRDDTGQSYPYGILSGRVELTLAFERLEGVEFSGEPKVVLTYQACSGQSCSMPRTVELDVQIDVED